MSGKKKTKKKKQLDTLTKVFQTMRSRNICWKDYRTTYL